MPRRPRLGADRAWVTDNRVPEASDRASADDPVSYLAVAERVIRFVCATNRLSADEADDFSSHARLKLIEADYAILRKFAGRSSIRTYLTVVIQRLFLDYRTAAWGKWRPSAEAGRQGETAILLERLLTRDGYSLDEAYELMTTNHGVRLDRAELERLAACLPVRVRRTFEGEDALELVADPCPTPEDALTEQSRAASASRIAELLNVAIASFPTQDQLVITLRFEDGRTVPEIGALLGEDQKALYRRLDRLLRELKSALESHGVRAEHIRDTFDAVIFHRDIAEQTRVRPSLETGARE